MSYAFVSTKACALWTASTPVLDLGDKHISIIWTPSGITASGKPTCSALWVALIVLAARLGLAKPILKDAEDIFVFNADVTCEFPLEEMLSFHKKHGKEGTIATTKVKDPSRFGVIVTDENDKILKLIRT